MDHHPSATQAEQPASRRGRWLQYIALAMGLPLAVVGWEYFLNTLLNPEVNWSLSGVATHMALDLAVVVPLVALVLGLGVPMARRLGLQRTSGSGILGIAGLLALLFAAVTLPWNSVRDITHNWMGTTYGISLAEVQTTVVRSDLTVREATQLCSLGSVRNPSLARSSYQNFGVTVWARLSAGFNDTLVQVAAFLPLLFLCLWLASRRRMGRISWAPAQALASWTLRPARLAAVAATGLIALFCFGGVPTGSGHLAVASAQTGKAFNACTDGGEVKEYDVSAINLTITLNRWGDHVDDAYMFALDGNLTALRQFEHDLEEDRTKPESLDVTRVSHGLRKDLIQPLVLRANLGDCLRINLTNRLKMDEAVSIHLLGLSHTVANAGGAVGNNPDTFAYPNQTVTYEIPIPVDPNAERAYYFTSHGAGRQQQNMGLFGTVVVEPAGATYLDVETGLPLDTEHGSNWEAIIVDPNAGNRPDGKNFREFVLIYHEIGDEGFTEIRDKEGEILGPIDKVVDVYRPAARAINYRSEPFRHRLEFDKKINKGKTKHGKSQGYGSYMFGDPATPMPRSYVGEGVKTRLVHGGSEVFHVHHLHGGGDRWRRNPNADPKNDFWKGLTKVPDPNLTSIHLDSQSIGPGTSYNLEHECGAGGCQQGVGDFLFHCHIGHHYIAGMWSFWRVYGTLQTAENNLTGHPLAVVPELFQNPSNALIPPAPPAAGVSASELIGLNVDGKVLVADAELTDPSTQMGLLAWVEQMLPPRGERIDNGDSTVWNWTTSGAGATLKVLGEPESDIPFAGYVSASPGERPEVLFNPKNGRYTYPLFRPQAGSRPPFTARHSGAPWLGEEMKEGRVDGLCARNGVASSVNVGDAVDRFYPVSAITLPIQVTRDRKDPDGMIYVLNEEEAAIRGDASKTQPLTIRSNVGDCVELILTNKIPDGPLNKEFSKVNLHTHFVQFDTQASDGVITGMSYEQSVRPIESEGRTLMASASAGSKVLAVNHTNRLREGIWLGIGLGEGTCGTTSAGQPKPCTEVRRITGLTANSITLDRPLENFHSAGQAVGVEFVRYKWYSDVDFGTVFYHQHVEFKDWDHGLFGTHVIEPKGSTYHDPTTGAQMRAGALADIRVDPSAGGNPVAHNIDGSFREFVLYLHNNSPVERPFTLGGGTINLRAEPWRLREGNAAYRFSSVTHGDPNTPMLRAYVGDPVVIRGMGLVERVGGVRFTGHRFHMERFSEDSDTRDGSFIGISERFDWSLEGGAGGPGGFPGDYLYYSTLGRDFESGAWGLMRVHDTQQSTLQPLPGIGAPPAGAGFPQLTHTGEAPPTSAGGPGQVCPASAPVRNYSIVARNQEIIYNDRAAPDITGVAYHLKGKPSRSTRLPLVLRANAGDCLRIGLRNLRTNNHYASLSIGELLFDPQRSYGAAIGYNHDSTVPPGSGRVYEFYADRELGVVIGLNLADVDSVEKGAFAGIVIEPEGAEYHRPGSLQSLPGGGTGIQADIVKDGVVTREFVALFSDQDRRIGQNTMPYPVDVENFNGINYSSEPLRLRNVSGNRADVFKSSLFGDPRHVVTVPAGTPMVYRVAQPWGNQTHLPTLEGHRYLQEPGMAGSEQVFNDVLVPGMSLNLNFVGGAGGDIEAPGDYLFLDRRQPFMEGGMWNMLRVTADGKSGGGDAVKMVDMEASTLKSGGGSVLSIDGLNTPRPAGDTAPWVDIYAGGASGERCQGKLLGRAKVDIGSGHWRFEQEVPVLPTEVCVYSAGGGVTTRAVGP